MPRYRPLNDHIDVCCLQALSDQATNRLSFAYKLRSPDNAVLHQFYNLSASGKDHMYAVPGLCPSGMLVLLQG